jgi:hypothetical protein
VVRACVAAALWCSLPGALVAQEPLPFENSPFLRLDPEKVVLDQSDSRVPCGECHTSEYEVWRQTTHATGFDEMHRTPGAQDILDAMDLRTAKRQESLCLKCHYTVRAPRLDAIAGVSCESCHGAAADWLTVHNDWGSGVEHPDRETPEHRAQRIEQSLAGGMLRPSGDLYAVAANCFECHTVPVEELVNVGGHRAGSRFELVEWASQVRHNYVEAQWSENTANRAPTDARTHLTYVTGRMLDFEYSIRGLARATIEDRYASAMSRRVAEARAQLEAIVRAVEVPEVVEVLRIGRDAPVGIGNQDALLDVATRIREIGQDFARSNDGSALAAIAPLLSGGAAVVAVPPAEPAATPGATAEPGAAAGPAAPAPAPGGSQPAAASGPAPTEPTEPTVPALPGQIRSRPAWFPPADAAYRTLADPYDCGGCHEKADIWWSGDAHSKSPIPLRNRDPRAVEIATLYGISQTDMARGDRICMSCHGTVSSLTPTAEVQLGVSCESCHGPASGYLDPHQEGGNVGLGMVNLNTADGRATNCVRCHRISDERLLAAGHPSGEGYDIAQADAQIRHWPDDGRRVVRERERRGAGPYVELAAADLSAAWMRLAQARPIPAVEVVSLPTPPPAPGRPPPPERAPARGAPPTAPITTTSPAPPPGAPGGGASTPAPAPGPSATSTAPATAPATAVPSVAPGSLSTEDILLHVKRRLEALRGAPVGGSP